ncbi:hypothetical protein [Flavobacterium sp. H122]|uniref:hypothetical protein n=1 Tax=Flavobacterium sp. H122 TaxID=2529860 RepID=UPI0010AAD04B|nr:hypothetical protein [Flavobacterium sp. H122]
MKNLIKFAFLGLFITSCSTTDDNDPNHFDEPLTTKMFPYIIYHSLSPSSENNSKLNFEYDTNKRLTKQIGGIISVSEAIGFSHVFTTQFYTLLTYNSNKVTVEELSSGEISPQKNTRYFTLNTKNQIITKEIPNTKNYLYKKLTFKYLDNKLSEIETTLPNMPYDPTDPWDYILTYSEKFYYDSNGNLTKTEYFEKRNGVNKGVKIIRTFEDYDNSTNPFKRLQLLDDFFYRSLSKNNFRKYTEVHYNNDEITSESTKTWGFNYDLDGKIIIN